MLWVECFATLLRVLHVCFAQDEGLFRSVPDFLRDFG